MLYSALFSIEVGLVMIGQWTLLYVRNQIPEIGHEPIRIWFHIAAEVITALALIVSGIALLAGSAWASSLYLVSMGMLFYTAIVSPGYFAQQGDWKWLGIFAVLIGLGIASLLPIS